jgi:hypothetical protein
MATTTVHAHLSRHAYFIRHAYLLFLRTRFFPSAP